MKIFRPKESGFSFEEFIPKEILAKKDIFIVDQIKDADVICTPLFRELESYIQMYGEKYKYLIWCNEPVWLLPEKEDYLNLFDYIKSLYGVSAAILTYQNPLMQKVSGLFLSPYVYPSHQIRQYSFDEKLNRIVYLASFRDSEYYENSIQSKITSLNRYRTRLALAFYENNCIDIHGKDWPDGISVADTREGAWIDAKLSVVSRYRFCLSIENTLVDNYITEKFWQPIATFTLPVYYSNGKSSIEDIAPKSSYIDAALFPDITSLTNYIFSMGKNEYEDRILSLRELFFDNLHDPLSYEQNLLEIASDIKDVMNKI